MNLSIKNGGLSLVINLGSGAIEVQVAQLQGKFNDNEWHQVRIRRELNQVSVKAALLLLLENILCILSIIIDLKKQDIWRNDPIFISLYTLRI